MIFDLHHHLSRPQVLHIISGLEDGGAEAVLYRLITADKDCEHRVISLSGAGKYGPLLADAGIKVHSLDVKSMASLFRNMLKLRYLIRGYKPNVVQTWMYHGDLLGGIVARMTRVRRIVWGLHNSTLDPEKSSRNTLMTMRLCARLSGVIPDSIIYCAQESRKVHENLGYSRKKGIVIPNGYDISEFKPDASARQRVRRELGIDNDIILLGCIARFAPQKDHWTLLQATRKLPQDMHLVLVGRHIDDSNSELIAMIHNLGIEHRVHLIGPRCDIPAIMNALDIHVLSSAFGEAFPNVLCEAMACGTPCVATNVGDCAQIVGTTGRICPPRQPDALAHSVLDLAANLQRDQPDLAARARIAENYSVERAVRAYQKVWFSNCELGT